MKKVLVELYIPIANQKYDIFIPSEDQMSNIVYLIGKVANELTSGLFVANEETSICNRESGLMYNINKSVNELGIKNGTKLMLI